MVKEKILNVQHLIYPGNSKQNYLETFVTFQNAITRKQTRTHAGEGVKNGGPLFTVARNEN